MIISKSVDIEIFPNLFSVTFVDLKSYLDTFRDCVDKKGRPKALTECLTVAEIKRRLDTVKSDIFYISDTDDSQLVELVGYINKMEAHYETTSTIDGNVTQIPIRTDLYGFNNFLNTLRYTTLDSISMSSIPYFEYTKADAQPVLAIGNNLIPGQSDEIFFASSIIPSIPPMNTAQHVSLFSSNILSLIN